MLINVSIIMSPNQFAPSLMIVVLTVTLDKLVSSQLEPKRTHAVPNLMSRSPCDAIHINEASLDGNRQFYASST